MVELRGVSKSFGHARALDGVDLTLRSGEVHGLLGQNGCGKSTLIKVLAGYHEPDHGSVVEVRGEPVHFPVAPGSFDRIGFAFVHQHLGLVPAMSVAENIGLTRLAGGTNLRRVSPKSLNEWAGALLGGFGVDLDPRTLVERLDGTSRALVAIVRAVDALRDVPDARGPGLLVLDEPTVFLPRSGVDRLFDLVHEVVTSGAAVLFVSHDLKEVAAITDRFTVLRDGRKVGEGATATTSTDELISLIVGRSVQQEVHTPAVSAPEPRLRLDGVSTERLSSLDLSVGRGEVVGLTGLMGSAYDELVYALAGARGHLSGSGDLDEDQLDLARWNPRRARAAGIALVPADRASQGAVGELSVAENLSLPMLDRVRRRGLTDRRELRRRAVDLLEEYDVRPRDPDAVYSSLSGGNQQKVLLATWLQTAPRLLVLHEPTQGVDIGSREEIHQTIALAATAQGMAVLCASTDYNELARICDRVLVFADDHVVGELTGEAITEDGIAEQVLRGSHTAALARRKTVA